MNIGNLNKAASDYDSLMEENNQYAFKAGVNWFMEQPISERLTNEEKEELCWYFNYKDWDRNIISNPELMTKSNQGRLIGIFGEEIFNIS